ncbi:MAG TPA: 7-carboxy-7-deazaguanine synthase QueE [Vineibacter sp.]|nr:7-carboxy-7-deazaguanine synthase QueE [Vineibacter sp.]
MSLIRISEIFGPTVQGEGALIGRPTVFVRTGGCDFRCTWCDTLYAVLAEYRHEWTPMTAMDILARVEQLTGGGPILVTLSGGNPATQPLGPLITTGRGRGHSFAMETQGSVARSWFAELDWLVLSPKPPSSGMPTDWNAVDACLAAAAGSPRLALKIVVFDAADYAYARQTAARYPALPVYLQVGNHTPAEPNPAGRDGIDQQGLMARFRWLVDRVAADRWFDVIVLPQLHVLAWGNERGV